MAAGRVWKAAVPSSLLVCILLGSAIIICWPGEDGGREGSEWGGEVMSFKTSEQSPNRRR